MSLGFKILSPFYFTRYPVTILAIILYAFVFESVIYSNYLPHVKPTRDFDRALADLSNITARPHPLLSHANDQVRAYLLSRVRSLPSGIEVVDDLNSTVKYASKPRPSSSYFEGTNILVKVPGSEKNDSGAVLISAHFDSVSTGPGVTDNGIGVVAALQLLEHIASLPVDKRPRRTAIFNLNNGEEDGLYGAHAFLVHPWANLTTTFLNIEGAGAGGRPMLFRSTSMAATASFIHANPKTGYYHTNVLAQDVYAMGVIRSRTDWRIYGEHMDGVDLAFYKNRAFYHTRFDTLEYAEGGAKALQAMIETVKSGGLGLLNAQRNSNDAHKVSVHFDVLGRFFVVMEITTLFIINVVLLVIGPMIVITLLVIYLIGRKRRAGFSGSDTSTAGTKLWRAVKAMLGVSQFWICLLISVAAQTGLAIGFIILNPLIVHSHPLLVLSSIASLAYLALVLSVTALQATGVSATKSKLISLASQYPLTWTLLVISTIYVRKSNIGCSYWITIWNACSFLGLLVGLIQGTVAVFTEGKLGGGDAAVYEEIAGTGSERRQDGTRKYLRGVEHRAETQEDEEGDREPDISETEPTEITPLMHQHRRFGEVVALDVPDPASKGEDEIGWWILQMVLTVPLPALFVYEITIVVLDSLSQTMVDGSSPLFVYAALCTLTTIILLPLTPFAHRMHGFLTYIMLITFVLTTVYCWMTFPFTQATPMRFSFKQSVDLDAGSDLVVQGRSPSTFNVGATTSITGLNGYINEVVASLPSARRSMVSCHSAGTRLTTCKWDVREEQLPSPGGEDADANWIQTDVKRLNETSAALIMIKGRNTRGCRVDFDRIVREYEVRELDGQGWAGQVPRGYTAVPRDGVKSLLLWSRTWDRKFEVWVRWDEDLELSGKIACEYAEYASGVAGEDEPGRVGKIPAFEEVLRFAPRWATVSRSQSDGLVEVSTRFRI